MQPGIKLATVMARKLRVEYEGAIYHVMNRGDRKEPIFRDDSDRSLFLETLGQACAKTDWQVHAYCLMNNHFHLVVETPKANLVAGMKWFLGTYTSRFNRRHKLFGHLFSGRYKSLVVDGSGSGYLRTVCDYVHLNPARAKLLRKEQKLEAFRWSSYGEYLKSPTRRLAWLRVDRVFGEMRIPKDSAAGRKEFQKRMEARRWEEEPEEWKRVRRGWYLGEEAFRKELLEAMGSKLGAEHYGEERQETALAKAERIVAEELKRRRWKQEQLEQRAKGDVEKIRMAERLRCETTMTLAWIAKRLGMGTKTHLAHLLYWKKRDKMK
jgi:REP-associated tyrosine transposase